ncbi:unnamed protein product, partial [Gulo gulo]
PAAGGCPGLSCAGVGVGGGRSGLAVAPQRQPVRARLPSPAPNPAPGPLYSDCDKLEQKLQVLLTCLKRVCRRSVPPEPLASLGSHFPPFAPLHDPTQAAGRGDAMGRKRGRRRDSPPVRQHSPLRPGILHKTFPASSLGRLRAKSAVVGGPWAGRRRGESSSQLRGRGEAGGRSSLERRGAR